MGPDKRILGILAANMSSIRGFGVRELAVFGSVARGSATESSDVDILVDFETTPSFQSFMGLRSFLEDLLGLPIDLADRAALRPALRETIEREALRVA
jgi:uncharacterized protein